jgi:hypothetical protein
MITLAGKQFIRETLQNKNETTTHTTTVSTEAFEIIQKRCGLDIVFPKTENALYLLDALHCKRSDFYFNLVEYLKNQIESICNQLTQNQLLLMLKETIKFIVVKELKSIPITIINNLVTIPSKVLFVLDEKMY